MEQKWTVTINPSTVRWAQGPSGETVMVVEGWSQGSAAKITIMVNGPDAGVEGLYPLISRLGNTRAGMNAGVRATALASKPGDIASLKDGLVLQAGVLKLTRPGDIDRAPVITPSAVSHVATAVQPELAIPAPPSVVDESKSMTDDSVMIPLDDETKADFTVRAKSINPSFEFDAWLAANGEMLRLKFPNKRIWAELISPS